MSYFKSWLGYAFAGVYVVIAIPMIYHAFHVTGGWISLRRLDVAIITFPSSFTIGLLLDALGFRPSYTQPTVLTYLDIGFHVVVTAAMLYALGYGIEWVGRRLLA